MSDSDDHLNAAYTLWEHPDPFAVMVNSRIGAPDISVMIRGLRVCWLD